ncbi:MAG TPA: hypothetical protein VF170_09390, partial [Planctomycetaceae bacterium]
QAWLDEQWRYVLDINPDRCSEGAPAGFVFGREIDRGRLGELVAAAERLLRGTGQSQKGLSGAAIDASFNPDDSDMPSPGDRHTLTVDVERGVAVLDGTAFPINSPQALRWLKVLLDRDGRPVSSSELEDFDPELLGARTDRLKKLLPPQIRALIHSKTGTGSRLVIRRDVT